MSETPRSYPCPFCGANANTHTGCAVCGQPPDPDAAEVISLNDLIRTLEFELDSANRARANAAEGLAAVRAQQAKLLGELTSAEQRASATAHQRHLAVTRRDRVAARVVDRVAAHQRDGAQSQQAHDQHAPERDQHAPDEPAGLSRGSGINPAPETSTRTVQNLLFVIGGLLLAAAAIVFTTIAWVSYGDIGRAVILGAATVLILAIPPVALWRRLRATAETFATLGLLLVPLDGYAAWYANVAGLRGRVDVTVFAAGVCVVAAALALGYASATQLAAPSLVGPLVAQPVLPLLAAGPGLGLDGQAGSAGWSAVYTAVAALDLALLWWSRRAARPAMVVSGELWLFAAVALGIATILALGAVVTSDTLPAAVRAGSSLVSVAAVFLAGSLLAGSSTDRAWVGVVVRMLRRLAGASLVLALFVAGGLVVGVGWPGLDTVLLAALPTVLALGVAALRRAVRGRDGGAWARGGGAGAALAGSRVGVLVAAGVIGTVLGFVALSSAAVTAGQGLPAWRADLVIVHERLTYADWQLLAAIALTTIAIAASLSRRAALDVTVLGAGALAFTVPATLPLPWWTVSIVDSVVALPLAVVASLRREPPVRRAIWAVGAAILSGHAILAGLARPASTAAVLGAVALLATIVAALCQRHRDRHELAPRWDTGTAIGAAAMFVALASLPAVAASAGELAAGEPAVTRACALLGLAVAAVLVTPSRRWWPEYALAAVAAVAVAGLIVCLAAAGTPQLHVYAATVFALDIVAGAAVLAALRRQVPDRWAWLSIPYAMLAAVPLTIAVALVAPAVLATLLSPYAWLDRVWSGTPHGVGLTPVDADRARYPFGGYVVALALLAVAAVLSRYGLAQRRTLADWATAGWFLVPAMLAGLVFAATAGARWPTVAVLSLATGVTATLVAARRPSGGLDGPEGPDGPGRPVADTAVLVGFGTLATGAGVCGALPTRPTTLTFLAVTLVAAVVAGMAGRTRVARTASWLVGVASAATLAVVSALAADIAIRWAAFGVLGVAALALGTSTVTRSRRAAEGAVVEAAAHATAVVALLLTIGSVRHMAGVLTLWGTVLGLRALWPGERAGIRRVRVVAGAACALVASWLLLSASAVAILEAYTAPAAGLALLAGWLAAQGRPELRSWLAYGPALLTAFGPSLATILVVEGQPLRRLALGTAAVAVVVAGSVRRLRAPVVVGGVVAVVVAAHEAILVWDLPPRWVPLLAAGLLLIGLASTYERRLRDLARLKDAVGRMR